MTTQEIVDTGSTSIMLEDNVFGVIIGWNAEANAILVQAGVRPGRRRITPAAQRRKLRHRARYYGIT